MSLTTRVKALEGKLPAAEPIRAAIIRKLVAPSHEGPKELGPIRGYVLTRPGLQLVREDGESAEEFEARLEDSL